MKITKKQRHEIYKKALVELESDHNLAFRMGVTGLCRAITIVTNNNYCYKKMDITYPELWLFRPEQYQKQDSFWDGNTYEIRRIILIFCIEMSN